jgi:hypothetical protein
MTTQQYLKLRRAQKCQQKSKPENRKPLNALHDKIGRLLTPDQQERSRMDIQKPDLILLPAEELDFIP